MSTRLLSLKLLDFVSCMSPESRTELARVHLAHQVLAKFLIVHPSSQEEIDSVQSTISILSNLSMLRSDAVILGMHNIFPKLCSLLFSTNEAIVFDVLNFLNQIFGFVENSNESEKFYWFGAADRGQIVAKLVQLRTHHDPYIAKKAAEALNLVFKSHFVVALIAGRRSFEALFQSVKEINLTTELSYAVPVMMELCRIDPLNFVRAGGLKKDHILGAIFESLFSPGPNVAGNRTYALTAMSALASHLGWKEMLTNEIPANKAGCLAATINEDVTFIVAGNQTVGGNKAILEEHPFFVGMFRDRFEGACDNTVSIPEVKGSVFKLVLHMLNGCGEKCEAIRNSFKEEGIPSLLETIIHFRMMETFDHFFHAREHDWIDRPEAYLSLLLSLRSGTGSPVDVSFKTKLKKNLLMYPFVSSHPSDLSKRVSFVDALVFQKSVTVETILIPDWKSLFQS